MARKPPFPVRAAIHIRGRGTWVTRGPVLVQQGTLGKVIAVDYGRKLCTVQFVTPRRNVYTTLDRLPLTDVIAV